MFWLSACWLQIRLWVLSSSWLGRNHEEPWRAALSTRLLVTGIHGCPGGRKRVGEDVQVDKSLFLCDRACIPGFSEDRAEEPPQTQWSEHWWCSSLFCISLWQEGIPLTSFQPTTQNLLSFLPAPGVFRVAHCQRTKLWCQPFFFSTVPGSNLEGPWWACKCVVHWDPVETPCIESKQTA